ncbi:hypothetical protein LA080_014978 [Diaporthe eres]|nr:hypothetical protein LA080_014978 [Diaporthe eres]
MRHDKLLHRGRPCTALKLSFLLGRSQKNGLIADGYFSITVDLQNTLTMFGRLVQSITDFAHVMFRGIDRLPPHSDTTVTKEFVSPLRIRTPRSPMRKWSAHVTDWKLTNHYALPSWWVDVTIDCSSALPQQDLICSNVDKRNADRHGSDPGCGNYRLLLRGSSTIQDCDFGYRHEYLERSRWARRRGMSIWKQIRHCLSIPSIKASLSAIPSTKHPKAPKLDDHNHHAVPEPPLPYPGRFGRFCRCRKPYLRA